MLWFLCFPRGKYKRNNEFTVCAFPKRTSTKQLMGNSSVNKFCQRYVIRISFWEILGKHAPMASICYPQQKIQNNLAKGVEIKNLGVHSRVTSPLYLCCIRLSEKHPGREGKVRNLSRYLLWELALNVTITLLFTIGLYISVFLLLFSSSKAFTAP